MNKTEMPLQRTLLTFLAFFLMPTVLTQQDADEAAAIPAEALDSLRFRPVGPADRWAHKGLEVARKQARFSLFAAYLLPQLP